jgi:hypothetical protein
MRAIVIDHFGPGLDNLVIKEVPEPEPKNWGTSSLKKP